MSDPTPTTESLTSEQIRAGWHYCPEFDYLLTKGEGDGPVCLCGNTPIEHHENCDVFDVDPAIGRPTKPCNCDPVRQ